MEVPECPPTPPLLTEGLSSPKRADESPTTSLQDRTSSPRSGSPEPNCPICLGPLDNKSYSDTCFHKFCFKCLLEWSKVKAECPLCKQKFKSIIHNVKSMDEYDQYTVQPNASVEREQLIMMVNHLNRLTMPRWWIRGQPPRRRHVNLPAQVEQPTHRGSILNIFDILPHAPGRQQQPHERRMVTRSSQQASGLDHRRHIYHSNLWAQPLADVTGRTREFSLSFYRRNPATTHRLLPWISRDLSALCERSQIALALERINNLLMRYDMRDPLFEQNIREYIGEHSRHFMHELISFARSPYDMMGYDRHVTHGSWYPHLQNYGLPEDDSSDSEDDIVELPLPLSTRATVAINIPPIDLSHTARFRVDRDVYTPPSRSPSPEAGPSGLSSFRANSPFLIESSDEESIVNPNGNDNDIGGSVSDVEVVAVLKPKHERTPEIIDLDSDSESNETALPNNSLAIPWDEPSTSHYGSSYVDPGPSTSSYNPNLTNSTGSEFKTETNIETNIDATINLSVMHNDSSISAHPVSSDTLSSEIPVSRKSKHKKHKKSKNRILSSDEESVDRYKSRHKKRKSGISKTSDYGSDYERKSRKRKHKHSSSRRYEEDRSSHNLSEESDAPSDHTVHGEKKKCCCKWKVKKVAEMSDCEQQKPRIRSIIVKMRDTDTGSVSHSSHSHSQPTSSDSDDNWEPQSRYKKFVRKGKGKRK